MNTYLILYLVIGLILSYGLYKSFDIDKLSFNELLDLFEVEGEKRERCYHNPNSVKFALLVSFILITLFWPILVLYRLLFI
jgi:hypothetical protein